MNDIPAGHPGTLLRGVAADLELPVGDATLLDSLRHWERTRPNEVYLTQPMPDGRVVDYTWRQVGQQVRRMASHLASLGLPPRSQIAILGKNSAHWIMADLAIWMAGHVSVPLYPTLSADTARYVLEHSEARLLFVGRMDELWAAVSTGIPASLPLIALPMAPALNAPGWEELVTRSTPRRDLPLRHAAELATIIYTSGSTGTPKGVMISFGAMVECSRRAAELLGPRPTDRMLSYLPMAHAAERALVESPSLYFGFRVYFAQSLDTFLADLRRARPTLFFSVPRLWTKFHQGICAQLSPSRQQLLFRIPGIGALVKRRILRQLGLSHVRLALTGSAPLAPALIDWYRSLGLELLEGYALSENFAYSHTNVPGDNAVGTVGRPNPGVEQRIERSGEILVRSPSNMMGYYKDPARTAEALTPDGFLRTGDMGAIDADGRLRITGRVKELFKTAKGKYVAPVPIENLLGAHELIESVCVTGVGLPQPIALLMLSPQARAGLGDAGRRAALVAALESLRAAVNARLEPHEQLDCLVVVKEPWTTANGCLTPTLKIRRAVIEKREMWQAEGWERQKQAVVFA